MSRTRFVLDAALSSNKKEKKKKGLQMMTRGEVFVFCTNGWNERGRDLSDGRDSTVVDAGRWARYLFGVDWVGEVLVEQYVCVFRSPASQKKILGR